MNSLLIIWLAIPIVALIVSHGYRKRLTPKSEEVGSSSNNFLDPLDYFEIEQEHIMVEYDKPVTQTDVRQLVLSKAPTAP